MNFRTPMTVAVLSVAICCSSSYGQERLVSVSDPDYSHLTEKINLLHHDLGQIHNAKTNPYLLNTLTALVMSKNRDAVSELGLIEQQVEELQSIRAKFDRKSDDVRKELQSMTDGEERDKAITDAVKELRIEATGQINDVLMDFQTMDVLNLKPSRIGVPKLLVDSPVGSAIQVSESQERKIRESSGRLSKKLEKLIAEARQEAFDETMDILKDDQKERFFDIYSESEVKRSFFQAPIGQLINQLKAAVTEEKSD